MDLKFFNNQNIGESTRQFFSSILGIQISLASKSDVNLKEFIKEQLTDNKLLDKVKTAHFVGMINNLALKSPTRSTQVEEEISPESNDYDMLLVFGVELNANISPNKSDITRLTRALNRRAYSRPVVLILKYGSKISFSSAERGQYKMPGKQGEKIARISMLRDIDINKVHAGHERIIYQLQINPVKVSTFKELYLQWLEVFNTNILNKEFYNELFIWYLWAVRTVKFPNKVEDDSDDTTYNSENVIRLLTRLIFIWFIKEKGLVPNELFEKTTISNILKTFTPNAINNSDYYKAILQNLFFATLNTEMPKDGGRRAFLDDAKKDVNSGYSDEYMDHLAYRYKSLFINPEGGLKLFYNIPFLNGGLFECLDRRDTETGIEMRIDGFSSKPSKQPKVPNVLFFGENNDLDLSNEFESGNKFKHCKARGIINILNSYKFTIEENTPLEQEIALDPELLGKIFENLLASYNPETKSTARKETGSYYTPRNVVNYMVDESLITYLKTNLSTKHKSFLKFGEQQTNMFGNEGKMGQLDLQINLSRNKWEKEEEKLENKLHKLFSYEYEANPFLDDTETTNAIITLLSECKILDPACGSGAFPMGILHKMVHALGKLDPFNLTWKQAQLEKAQRDKNRALQFEDKSLREIAVKCAEDKVKFIEASFGKNGHELDYSRKLFLIENCVYGIDIQQIAVQISKLRFFISLMVDQNVNDSKPNRNILSLPNLETKFVSANTLIPIDKPKQATIISMDAQVKKVEDELHEIRQQIFFIKRWSEKKKLKKDEKIKRKELETVLINSGFPTSAAGQIASWDPFDPLTTALFFDPEIMFSSEKFLSGGYFDIVIGNPPYGVTVKDNYRKTVVSDLGKVPDFEIYYFFINKAYKLLKQYGIQSYIIPNTILFNIYAKNYRLQLLEKWQIIELLDCTNFKIFEGASVRNVINILQKNNANKEIFYRSTKAVNSFSELISKKKKSIKKEKLVLNNNNWGLLFKLDSNVLDVIEKIKKNKLRLSEIFKETSQGLIAYDKYQGQDSETIRNRIYHTLDPSKNWQKWLWGEDITRYVVNWNNKEYINYCGEIANPREPKYFKNYRILVREITNPRIFAAITEEELYHDPAIIAILNNPGNNLLFLLAILNSKLATFFHFNSSPKASKGEFPKILVDDINNFPLPKITELNSSTIHTVESIAYKLIDHYRESVESSSLENYLDLIIFKLYDLKYDECLIIDPAFKDFISCDEFENKGIDELCNLGIYSFH